MDLPLGIKVVGNKWVYKLKKNNDGLFEWSKALLMDKCYVQKSGIDFSKIFFQVGKLTIVRVLLLPIAIKDLELEKLNEKQLSCMVILKKVFIWIKHEGYKEKEKEHLVCRIKKYMYGLKLFLRMWYKKINTFVKRQGFSRSEVDYCAYYKILMKPILLP